MFSHLLIKVLFFIFTGVILMNMSYGQVEFSQPHRIEINYSEEDNAFFVASAKEEGLVLFRETKDYDKSGNYKWEYIKLDTALNHDWGVQFYVDKEYSIIGYEYRLNKFYTLFYKTSGSSVSFRLIQMDLHSGNSLQYDIKDLASIELTEFTIVGDYAMFIGKVNGRASVFTFHLKEKRVKVLKGLYKPQSEILDINVDEDKEVYSLIMSERTYDRKNTISVRTYDFDGNLLYTVVLKPEKEYNLLDARSSMWGKDGTLIISGTYSGKRYYSQSEGLFLARVNKDGEKIVYCPYPVMDNFFANYKPKKAKKLKEKNLRKLKKGKPFSSSYRSRVNTLIEKEGEYLILTEFFYPNSSSNQRSLYHPGFNFNAPPYRHLMNNNRVVITYKYTHALLASFNKEGTLKWDNALVFDDVTTMSPKSISFVSDAQDSTALFYLKENKVYGKIFKESEFVDDHKMYGLKLLNENDRDSGTDFWEGGMERWYNNYFYVYGIQNIKGTSSDRVKRKVFYINKVQFK